MWQLSPECEASDVGTLKAQTTACTIQGGSCYAECCSSKSAVQESQSPCGLNAHEVCIKPEQLH